MGRKKTIKTIDEVLENSKTDQQHQEENLVKKTCRELGITQKELAEKIKVSRQTVSDWATGRIKISETIEYLLTLVLLEKEYFEFKKAMQGLMMIQNNSTILPLRFQA